MFDKESEGFMTFQDLEPYLSCVFKVLQEVEPSQEGAQYSAEDLGHSTAKRVFRLAGKDDREDWIFLDEFKSWAHSTKTAADPTRTSIERLSLGSISMEQEEEAAVASGQDETELAAAAAATGGEHLTFYDARVLTHLHERNCNEVFEHFKRYADNGHVLDIRAFRRVFYHLLTEPLSGGALHDSNNFVDNLFGHFDADRSGGVDFHKLVAGSKQQWRGQSALGL